MGPLRWLVLGAALALSVAPVGAAIAATEDDEQEASAPDDNSPAADEKPSAPTPSLRVSKLQFRGNRKVEDDAIKMNLKTAVGATLTQEMIREDVRRIRYTSLFVNRHLFK